MNAEVLDTVRRIAADVFEVAESDIGSKSSPLTVDNWDSTQQLNLVLALEERFNVQLEPEDIEKMKNIGEIAHLLETKLNASNTR